MHPAAEDDPASTSAPPGRKKSGGRPPIARVHAAPVAMDDGTESGVDEPAIASQDRNRPPAVTHARRQAQTSNKSTVARQSVHTSHHAVTDDSDEEEVIEEEITDQEDEDDIYGGIDGAVGDALGNEVGQLSHCRISSVCPLTI